MTPAVNSARHRSGAAALGAVTIPMPVVGRAEALRQHGDRMSAKRTGELGNVHSWELVTAVDGPGTRLTYFLSGCALRCQYCHNPDTWKLHDGTPTTIGEITARIDRYEPLIRAAHGGITLSGGEPLFQPAFTRRILRHCREMGLHTALDTSGYLGTRADDAMLDDVDLVLLDIKSGLPDTYRTVTGRDLAPTLSFGRRLAIRRVSIWIRFVLVPGLTDAVDNVNAVAEYVASLQGLGHGGSVQRVEILPFHQMARSKWHALNLAYPLEAALPAGPALIERVQRQFRARGLIVY